MPPIFGPVFDSLQEGIVAANRNGQVIYCNSSLEEMTGFNHKDLVGNKPPFPCWPKQATTSLQHQCESCPLLAAGTMVEGANYCDLKANRYPLQITFQLISDSTSQRPVQLAAIVGRESQSGSHCESHTILKRQLEKSDQALRNIAINLMESGTMVSPPHMPICPELLPSLHLLSRREWEILNQLLSGRRVPSLASSLFISANTVRNHLKSIFRKVGVHSQSELLEYLQRPNKS